MTGLDLSPNMVAQARARHPDLTVIQGSFTVPPMPRGGDPRDPGWALVTAWYAFVHLAPSELVPTLTALTRVLRRGGVLALATHLGRDLRHPGSVCGVATDLEFVLHDADSVVAAAEAAGLVEIEWYRRSPAPVGSRNRAALPPGPPTGLSRPLERQERRRGRYWSPPRTAVMRWVLKPSQCIRPT